MISKRNSQILQPAHRGEFGGGSFGWSIAVIVIAAVVLAPMASVIWIAFHPTDNIWPHLMQTVSPRYVATTLRMMFGVGLLAAIMGVGTAWLVTMYRFAGSRILDWALLFPLAIPAYIGAYALVDFMDYAGPLQSGLRASFGWQDARAYWFPEVRSEPGAMVVLAAALYPYVYLLTRAALHEQSGNCYEVARSLGLGPQKMFLRLGLPMLRPAIATGVALVMMETVADFGTMQHFGVQTLTTGVFSTWLNGNNAGGAAQIAGVILVLILGLVAVERRARRHRRFHGQSRAARPLEPVQLSRGQGAVALALCLIPLGLGFILPMVMMGWHAFSNPAVWTEPGLAAAALNSVLVAGFAAALTVMAALFLVYGVRMVGRKMARIVLPVTTLGYAAPGAVLALGLLVPLAALDHRVADLIQRISGYDPGLLLTGTAAAIVLAYVVRFFGIAQGAVDAAFGRISPSLPMAARSLGRGAGGTLGAVYLPMMRGSVAASLLVVFVDCIKELPATLLLRPFNFNTLSTRVYELASLEQLSKAAPAALLVVAMGLAAVGLLARATQLKRSNP